MNIKILVSCVFMSGCCCHPVTPRTVRRDVGKLGAKATVKKLWTNFAKSDWERMIEGVVSGQQKWLDIVPLIEPGTDAGATEDLILALSEALPKNPAGVLKLISEGEVLTYRQICNSPVMEGGTIEESQAYYAAAKVALENLKDPLVEDKRVKCLAEITKGYARVHRAR